MAVFLTGRGVSILTSIGGSLDSTPTPTYGTPCDTVTPFLLTARFFFGCLRRQSS